MALIKSIEKVNISLVSVGSNSVGLTKGQDIDNCVPFATWESGTNDLASVFIDIYFGAGPTLYVQRNGTAGTISLTVYVVEFEPAEVSVQQGTFSMSGTSTNSTITAVTEAKTFVVSYYRWSGSVYFYDSTVRTRLTSTTNIDYTRQNSTGTVNGHYYVVEDIGSNWTVQHADLSIINPATSDTTTITAVDEDRTFLVASYYNRYGAGRADYSAVTVYLSNSTTIGAEQQLNTAYPADSHIRAQAITFISSGDVQRSQRSFGSGDTEYNETLSPSVDLDYTIANIPTTIPFEKTNYNSSYLGWYRAELTSTTNLNVQRWASGQTSLVSWEAVSWPSTLFYFDGYVKEEGVPVVRTVRAHRRDNGEVMFETTSSGGAGYFYGETTYSGAHYVVCLDDLYGESYNLLAYDMVYPTISG
jgi:hypothetical protein